MVRTDNGEMVKLSPGNWLAIGLFFAGQTAVLLAAGIGMYTRLAVLEERVQNMSTRQTEAIQEIQANLQTLKIDNRNNS